MWIQAGAGISRWQPEDTFLLSNTSRPNLGPPTLLFSDDRELLPRGLSSPAAMVIIHLHLVPKLRVELYLHYPCVPSWHVHGQLYLYLYLYWAKVLVNPRQFLPSSTNKYIKAAVSWLRYLHHRPVEEQWASVGFAPCVGVWCLLTDLINILFFFGRESSRCVWSTYYINP